MRYFVVIAISILFFSCRDQSNVYEGKTVLVKMGEVYLFEEDLPASIFVTADSSTLKEQYIEEWLRDQAMIKEASKIIDLNAVDAKVDDYRTSLILAEYQKLLLEENKIDFSDEELLEEYEKVKENFVSNQTLFDVQYFIFSLEIENESAIRTSLNSGSLPEWLQKYCEQNPSLCNTERENWMPKENFKATTSVASNLLYTTSNYQLYYTDDLRILMFRINKIIKEGEAKPFEMIKEEIKELASYQKKQQYLQEIVDKTYQTAKNNDEFEIYRD